MLDFNLSSIFLFLVLYTFLLIYLRLKRNKSFMYLLFWSLFYVYLVNVIKYTQYPMFIIDFPFSSEQTVFQFNIVNPFGDDLRTTLLNILLFVPFGFGLPFIAKTNWAKIGISSLLFTIMIETLQLMQHVLFAGSIRIVDINDVIHNTFGGLIGYLLFRVFARLYNIVFTVKKDPNTLIGYISSSTS